MLGLFDSGLGGLTVLRRVRDVLPSADVLYFADQAHVPYGDRSAEELQGLLRANVAFLNARGCDAIVMACNTSCAIASSYGWPPSRATIFDLIEAAATAIAECDARAITVIATAATVRAGAYARAIHARLPGARVAEIAAPALVPLIESPATSPDEMAAAVRGVCGEIAQTTEALVYGCTHYPLVDELFARFLPGVARLDPARRQAAAVAGALGPRVQRESGRTWYVTSGPLEPFVERLGALRGSDDSIEGIIVA